MSEKQPKSNDFFLLSIDDIRSKVRRSELSHLDRENQDNEDMMLTDVSHNSFEEVPAADSDVFDSESSSE